MIRRNKGGLRITRKLYKNGKGAEHVKLETNRQGKFYFVRGKPFQSVEELVSHYQAVDVANKHRLGDPLLNKTAQSMPYFYIQYRNIHYFK